jgi:hypothetical protein
MQPRKYAVVQTDARDRLQVAGTIMGWPTLLIAFAAYRDESWEE